MVSCDHWFTRVVALLTVHLETGYLEAYKEEHERSQAADEQSVNPPCVRLRKQ